MATFSARNCPVGYTIEGIPACTTKTRTKPTENYYIFHDADSNQCFEGFKGKSKSVAGYWETKYIHPLIFDLSTPVYKAATNATPHAYIKDIIDTYFKFCDYSATSIDDSFAAMDFPAYNGQSVGYVIRAISQLKKNWFYPAKDSLTVYWNDGTTNGAKHIRFGTEPVVSAEQEGDPISADLVTVTGGFLDGTRLTSTAHAATPGSVEVVENFPELVTQAPLDLMSAAMLATYEQPQIFYTVGSAKRGLHQIGNTMLFNSGGKLATGEITVFIHGASYDLVEKIAKVRLGKYMQLPYRSRLKPQELNQLVDNIEKNVVDSVALASDLTATATEINTACDGITATAAEINTTSDGDTAKNNHTHDAVLTLAVGSSNKALWAMSWIRESTSTYTVKGYWGGNMNVNGTDAWWHYNLDLPPYIVIGGTTYYLHVDQVSLRVYIADASDYVTSVRGFGIPSNTAVIQLLTDGTNRTSTGTYIYTLSTEFDASTPYVQFAFGAECIHTTANQLRLFNPLARYWYEA